jgi:hypothetical protein
MKIRTVSLVAFFAIGCGSASQETLLYEGDGGTGGGGSGGAGQGDAGPYLPATQLSPGMAALVGVTDDGHALYRKEGAGLEAIPIQPGFSAIPITDQPGTIVIKGKAVFSWADVDWETNLGRLLIWTADGGAHEVGTSLYAEDMVAASPDGRVVVYNVNVSETASDLMVAPSDLSAPKTLIAGMGRGSQDTCRASFTFVGERLFVAWCAPGSQGARIERYQMAGADWVPTLVAEGALSSFSADKTGERIFYQSGDYQGQFAENGASKLVDASVSGGVMLPDGSAIFYNVSDQLRRTDVPEINPIPIVTRGFAQRAEFSPGYDHVLYSRKVTYEAGTQRDLLLADTFSFNPTPVELVAEPVASLSRSVFTGDGKHVLYMTDVTPNGSTLVIYTIESGREQRFENVDTVLASPGSKVVFSDNRSDPEKYPIVADLKVVDPAGDAPPALIEAQIIDGRSFYLSPGTEYVVYVRSGLERDPEDPSTRGVFVQSLP